MSFVTFIIAESSYIGKTGTTFDPAIIGYINTKSMFLWCLEATILKGLFYFFYMGNPAFFEMMAYTGYKFVVLAIIALT